MLSFLKHHPFAVEAFFESSLVLTFAVPKTELQSFLPECLELDTFKDEWAFIAMALVKTKSLRLKGFPKFMGNDFYLIGYRIFVKYTNNAGKRLRGLYILKSETDKKKMEFLGNIFTKYKYTTTDIAEVQTGNIISISSVQSNFNIDISTNNENVSLPASSPFADWKEARRFAGPLPFTFSYNTKTKEVLIIQGVREDWMPKPVDVLSHDIAFIKNLQFKNIKLANAFAITNIPYYWKKGKVEKWNN